MSSQVLLFDARKKPELESRGELQRSSLSMDPSQPTSRSDSLPPAAETANLVENENPWPQIRQGWRVLPPVAGERPEASVAEDPWINCFPGAPLRPPPPAFFFRPTAK